MRFKCLYLLLFFSAAFLTACSQSSTDFNGDRFRCVFYNVENLFDTYDDPKTSDNEFTPYGSKKWTSEKYKTKLINTARAIKLCGGDTLWPDIIGLAEIENRTVLNDLLGKTAMADGNYGLVQNESPDPRGIDVAFLFNKRKFLLLDADFIKIDFGKNSAVKTRDLLYVCGILGGIDTIHYFVCHMPSMKGGEKESDWKRIKVAEVLKQRVDKIRNKNSRANVFIMGDMNGGADAALFKSLGACKPSRNIQTANLYNTSWHLFGKNIGTYRYEGKWETLDHILVSGSLLDGEGKFLTSKNMSICDNDMLLRDDKKSYGKSPNPTYIGAYYSGGYSDHLPVYIDLVGKTK